MSSSLINKPDHHLSEMQQSIIRLAIGLCILGLLLWLNHGPANISFENTSLVTIIGYCSFSALLIITIWMEPTSTSIRRSAAIFADLFAATLLLIFGGKYAAPICITYYLLIISNGLNRHTGEFRISTSLSIIGFSCVLYLSDFWQSQLTHGIGLLLGMVISAMLISKQVQGNKTTEVADNHAPSNTKDRGNIKVLLITQDAMDRHMTFSYINSWEIPVKTCNSAVRTFAEIINAVDNEAGYTTVIVDSLNLDMDPVLFSKSLRFENKLVDINLIHISPPQPKEQEKLLLTAGYSKLITTPLDKTILFDAIHATTPEIKSNSNITKLISRYSSNQGSTQPSDILLAIGNPIEQTLFRSILEKAGQRVYSVSSGSQALDALNTHQFDMVIIDFKMSDIHGKDVIRLYYYTFLDQEWVPFIALVDEATSSVLSQCREAEVGAVLVRPVDEQKLLMTVADIAASKAKQSESINNPWKPARNSNTLIADNSGLILNTHTLRQLEHLSSSSNFLEHMVSNFQGDMSASLRGLQQAIDNISFTEFQDFAHAMRDTSCNLGAVTLHRLSLKALQINQNEFQQQGKSLLNELYLALEKTMHALREYVIDCNDAAKEKE